MAVPLSPNITYSNTYTDGLLMQESWLRTNEVTLIKKIDYTYTDGLPTTEVRMIFSTDGQTSLAQITITSTYTNGVLTGQTILRNF